jgi:hypothetical protein
MTENKERECVYCDYTLGISATWDYDKNEKYKPCPHNSECKKAKEKGLSLRYCQSCTGEIDDGLFCPNEKTCESRVNNFLKHLSSKKLKDQAQTRVEDAQRWHANQELNQRINYRQAVEQVRRNESRDQILEMRARPNPFVPPFQNGL